MGKPKSEQIISVPAFLNGAEIEQRQGVAPRCDFCTQVACETDAMACGQCDGQTCSGQCSSSQCGASQACQDCQGVACQSCQCSTESSQGPAYIQATFSVSNITQTTARINVVPGSGYTSFNVLARYRDSSTVVYEWEFKANAPFPADISGLEPGMWYKVNVCSIDGSRKDWGTGKDFQTKTAARPLDWSWWSDVRAGQPVAFSAAEFQAFYDKIDEFRIYKGAGAWPNFIPVSKGMSLSAAILNETRAAIAPITTAALPPTAYQGDTITAGYFNKLKDYLNSVT